MMCLALLTGIAAFVGVRLAMRHGHWRHRAWAGHCGGHGRWHDDDLEPGGGHWGGSRGGMFLRAVMNRIGARPDQEEAIRAAVSELRDSATRLRGEGRKAREEIADALRKPSFDEVAMGELFARHDTLLESLRKSLVGALARTHDALDEKQRHRLADILAHGPRPFGRFDW
jgi:uncharacterized membrane protein